MKKTYKQKLNKIIKLHPYDTDSFLKLTKYNHFTEHRTNTH